MKISNTEIEGVYILENFRTKDERGEFSKIYNEEEFLKIKDIIEIKEVYYSISKKNVIRGMHFQTPPYDHEKIVTIISGRVLDVVVDLRKHSKTYGKHICYNLSGDDNISILIPKGCAHGFKTIEDDTIMMYMVSSIYKKEYDSGIKWDSIGLNWKIKEPIISERDNKFESLEDFKSPF